MQIRRAFPKDAKRIREIFVSAYQTSFKGFIPEESLKELTVDEDHIKRTEAYLEHVEGYVSVENQRVIAFAYLLYPKKKDSFEINMLYVDPNYQKKGAGSLLLNFLFKEKAKQGFKKAIAWTFKNGISLGFYQKLKFTPTGLEKKGEYNLPIIELEKILSF